ncbi:MAG: MFS transporter [Erysipelotrichaceae bacterium]|nr:MFS transporter [Erysipelotrichaceae bacterium]
MLTTLLVAVIYLIFISLGLPDSLLGAGWPVMQGYFNVPSSYAGYVSMTVSFMTIISALLSPKLMSRFHTKWIVIVSILLSAFGLIGYSVATEYWMLFIFAIPYGLGAGAIDASINNYVAVNYSSSIMNFLHCFYGLGAMISPYIMATALKYAKWNQGYTWTAYLQLGIMFICILSLPLWKKNEEGKEEEESGCASISETLKVKGVIYTLIAFFGYCAGEATCFLWTASYFAGTKSGLSAELIASFASLIFGGLMLGRIISGFISNKLDDKTLIRIGTLVELIGVIMLFIPSEGYLISAIGFVVIGTGMGPIYPSIQHMAPINFGKKYSATVISLQMASAYVGSTFMPMVFGNLQMILGIEIMPVYVLIFLVLTISFMEITYIAIGKK